MAGHRNHFENNEILDNGNETEGYGIRILGETHDLIFQSNCVGDTGKQRQRIGIYIGEQADKIALNNNDLSSNLEKEVEDCRAVLA